MIPTGFFSCRKAFHRDNYEATEALKRTPTTTHHDDYNNHLTVLVQIQILVVGRRRSTSALR
jgi:hypothetical protein